MLVTMKETDQAALAIQLFANPPAGETQNVPANSDGVPVWAITQDPAGGSVLTPAADGLSAVFLPGPVPAGQTSIQVNVSASADGDFSPAVQNVVENFIITVNAIPVEFIRSSAVVSPRPQTV